MTFEDARLFLSTECRTTYGVSAASAKTLRYRTSTFLTVLINSMKLHLLRLNPNAACRSATTLIHKPLNTKRREVEWNRLHNIHHSACEIHFTYKCDADKFIIEV